jgi:hypothetical protein
MKEINKLSFFLFFLFDRFGVCGGTLQPSELLTQLQILDRGTLSSSLQSCLPSFRYWTEVQYHPAYRAIYPASDTGQRYSIIQPKELLTQLQILDRGTVQCPLGYTATCLASDTGQRYSAHWATELLTQLQILDRGTVPTRLQCYLPSFRYWK